MSKNSSEEVGAVCNALADRLTTLDDAAELIQDIRNIALNTDESQDRTFAFFCKY